MTGRSDKAVRRLAQALLDAALARPEGPARVRQALRESHELIGALPEARAFLEHPGVPAPAKEKVIAALAGGAAAAEDPPWRLARLLAQRRALRLLPAIERAFLDLWNARRGVVAAEAISAVPLAAGAVDALRQSLERASRQSVELTTSVDPSLMGGVVVRVAGRTLDGSVRGRLKALRTRLQQVATR